MKCIQLIALGSACLLPLYASGNPPPIELVDACENEEESASEQTYLISCIQFEYDQTHPKQIPFEELERIEIRLYQVDDVFYGGKTDLSGIPHESIIITIGEINKEGKPLQFTQSAIDDIVQAVFNDFVAHDINWSIAYIPDDEISENGIDLRPPSDTTLTIAISTPIIKKASVKFVDQSNPSREIANENYSNKICDQLPLSLPDPSSGYPGDFINSNILNDYLHSLNRHPERRVDLEIGPTNSPGEVALDFVVTQKRPYHFYFNANNNVPRPIHRWQETTGFIQTQLTGNDDILKLNASTDSFDKFYTLEGSYEAPIGRSIGNRWQIYLNYNRFISAEFALPQNLFVGTQTILNGEVICNVGQWNKLFLDFVADLQYRHIHNRDHFFFSSTTKNFLIPEVGLKLIQLKRETKLIASLSIQSTVSSAFWDVKKHLDGLGRADLSPNWAIVQAGLYGSFYIETFFKNAKHLANEIVFVGQMQNAFRQRLIPELEGILGGLYSIRGYPQSTVAGDDLYMGSVEYRFHLPAALRIDPHACTKLFGKSFRWAPAQPKGTTDWDFIFRAFYDVGETTVNQRKRFEHNHLLMGAGFGGELVLWQNVFIRADWGTAFRAANGVHNRNHQLYFSSTVIY